MLLTDNSRDCVDWGQPINWSHPLNRGLVAWYLADPASGVTGFGSRKWVDLTRRHGGTLTNFTGSGDWQTISPTGMSGSLDFDGQNDYVAISPSIGFPNFSGWTVSGWVRPEVINGNDSPFMGDLTSGCAPVIRSNLSSKWELRAHNGSSFYVDIATVNNATINEWQWVCGTYDGIEGRLYVDGVLCANGGTGSSASVDSGVRIGGGFNTSADEFNGQIADVKVHNRGMRDAEAWSLYQQGCTGNPGLLNRVPLRRVSPIEVVGGGFQPAWGAFATHILGSV